MLDAAQVQARKDEQELVITGEHVAPAAPEEAEGAQRFRRRTERRFGKFSRTFSVRHPLFQPWSELRA